MSRLCTELLFVCSSLLMFSPPTDGQGDGTDVFKVFAKQDDDVILPCNSDSEQNLERKRFDWEKVRRNEVQQVFLYEAGFHSSNGYGSQDEQFRGRVSHFPDQLKNGNASIMIRKTRMADNGRYICTFPQLQQIKEVYVDLVVVRTLKDRTGEVSGAAPPPDVTLSDTKDKLQCDVKGVSPEPKVEWWDGAGNLLPAEEPRVSERGGSYSVTLTTDITLHHKLNQLRCVVTQNEISHQIHTEFNVASHYIKEKSHRIWTGVLIGALIGVILILLVLCGVTMYRNRILRLKRKKDLEEAQDKAQDEAWERDLEEALKKSWEEFQREIREKSNNPEEMMALESNLGTSCDDVDRAETTMSSPETEPLNTK